MRLLAGSSLLVCVMSCLLNETNLEPIALSIMKCGGAFRFALLLRQSFVAQSSAVSQSWRAPRLMMHRQPFPAQPPLSRLCTYENSVFSRLWKVDMTVF